MAEAEEPSPQLEWGEELVERRTERRRFYKSFILNGVTVSLHDNVLLYNEGGAPFLQHIGSLWEKDGRDADSEADEPAPDSDDEEFDPKSRMMMKGRWFFRAVDLLNEQGIKVKGADSREVWLEGGRRPTFNANPLLVVLRKATVACLADHPSIHKPTKEQIRSADFILRKGIDSHKHRIIEFDQLLRDVETYNLSDKFDPQLVILSKHLDNPVPEEPIAPPPPLSSANGAPAGPSRPRVNDGGVSKAGGVSKTSGVSKSAPKPSLGSDLALAPTAAQPRADEVSAPVSHLANGAVRTPVSPPAKGAEKGKEKSKGKDIGKGAGKGEGEGGKEVVKKLKKKKEKAAGEGATGGVTGLARKGDGKQALSVWVVEDIGDVGDDVQLISPLGMLDQPTTRWSRDEHAAGQGGGSAGAADGKAGGVGKDGAKGVVATEGGEGKAAVVTVGGESAKAADDVVERKKKKKFRSEEGEGVEGDERPAKKARASESAKVAGSAKGVASEGRAEQGKVVGGGSVSDLAKSKGKETGGRDAAHVTADGGGAKGAPEGVGKEVESTGQAGKVSTAGQSSREKKRPLGDKRQEAGKGGALGSGAKEGGADGRRNGGAKGRMQEVENARGTKPGGKGVTVISSADKVSKPIGAASKQVAAGMGRGVEGSKHKGASGIGGGKGTRGEASKEGDGTATLAQARMKLTMDPFGGSNGPLVGDSELDILQFDWGVHEDVFFRDSPEGAAMPSPTDVNEGGASPGKEYPNAAALASGTAVPATLSSATPFRNNALASAMPLALVQIKQSSSSDDSDVFNFSVPKKKKMRVRSVEKIPPLPSPRERNESSPDNKAKETAPDKAKESTSSKAKVTLEVKATSQAPPPPSSPKPPQQTQERAKEKEQLGQAKEVVQKRKLPLPPIAVPASPLNAGVSPSGTDDGVIAVGDPGAGAGGARDTLAPPVAGPSGSGKVVRAPPPPPPPPPRASVPPRPQKSSVAPPTQKGSAVPPQKAGVPGTANSTAVAAAPSKTKAAKPQKKGRAERAMVAQADVVSVSSGSGDEDVDVDGSSASSSPSSSSSSSLSLASSSSASSSESSASSEDGEGDMSVRRRKKQTSEGDVSVWERKMKKGEEMTVHRKKQGAAGNVSNADRKGVCVGSGSAARPGNVSTKPAGARSDAASASKGTQPLRRGNSLPTGSGAGGASAVASIHPRPFKLGRSSFSQRPAVSTGQLKHAKPLAGAVGGDVLNMLSSLRFPKKDDKDGGGTAGASVRDKAGSRSPHVRDLSPGRQLARAVTFARMDLAPPAPTPRAVRKDFRSGAIVRQVLREHRVLLLEHLPLAASEGELWSCLSEIFPLLDDVRLLPCWDLCATHVGGAAVGGAAVGGAADAALAANSPHVRRVVCEEELLVTHRTAYAVFRTEAAAREAAARIDKELLLLEVDGCGVPFLVLASLASKRHKAIVAAAGTLFGFQDHLGIALPPAGTEGAPSSAVAPTGGAAPPISTAAKTQLCPISCAHFAQGNHIEFDLALEWRLLQMQQDEERRRLLQDIKVESEHLVEKWKTWAAGAKQAEGNIKDVTA